MFKSIFGRLFWTNAVVLAAVFVVITLSMTIFARTYISDRQYNAVMGAAENIENMTVSLRLETIDVRMQETYMQSLASWAEYLSADIAIVNRNGEVYVATSDMKTVPQSYMGKIINAEIVRENGKFGGYYDKRVFTVGVPLYYKSQVIGGMFFNTKMPVLNKLTYEIIYMFAISAAVVFVIAFAVIYFQSRNISKPIKELNKAAMDIAAGRFDRRMTITSTDELGQLASSFNFMADSLERLEEARSSFVSDISHELRTPMTSVSGFIQGILDKTIPPEKENEYLTIVLDETKRLTRLVNNMLETSKISNLNYNLDMCEVDITEMIRRAVIQLESKISQKDLDIDIHFEKECMKVMADGDSIRRVIINLLDNAIKFSYNNTQTDINVWEENSKVYTSVGNYGMGIEEAELRKVFDRFYKTDKSRSSDKKGAGLGLYLVKNILLCHKQDIWVESTPVPDVNMKYTKFTFTLEKV